MKEYLLLIREDPCYGNFSDEEMLAAIAEHVAWIKRLLEKGCFKDGSHLAAVGSILQGDTVTDGPFMEAKECVSGYYLLMANSLEQAINLVKDCPDRKLGASLEIREIMR